MRAAAILGLGCSPKGLTPFQDDKSVDWQVGMPAAGDRVDVILIFGGDGTVHRHLGQLVKLGLPVLVVPVGSGNDFARALGLRRLRESVAAWKRFRTAADNVRTIDLGIVAPIERTRKDLAASENARDSELGPRYFCSVAGIGLDGEVARRANQWPRWLRGNGGYVLSLFPALFRFAPFPMKILTLRPSPNEEADNAVEADWISHSAQPTILAAFGNTSTYGGGMRIAPRATMDDGLLDVCVVSEINKLKLLSIFPSVYFGRHLGMAEVDYFQAPRLRIETERPVDVYADGEYVCQTPVEIGIQRDSLRVIVHPSQTSF